MSSVDINWRREGPTWKPEIQFTTPTKLESLKRVIGSRSLVPKAASYALKALASSCNGFQNSINRVADVLLSSVQVTALSAAFKHFILGVELQMKIFRKWDYTKLLKSINAFAKSIIYGLVSFSGLSKLIIMQISKAKVKTLKIVNLVLRLLITDPFSMYKNIEFLQKAWQAYKVVNGQSVRDCKINKKEVFVAKVWEGLGKLVKSIFSFVSHVFSLLNMMTSCLVKSPVLHILGACNIGLKIINYFLKDYSDGLENSYFSQFSAISIK